MSIAPSRHSLALSVRAASRYARAAVRPHCSASCHSKAPAAPQPGPTYTPHPKLRRLHARVPPTARSSHPPRSPPATTLLFPPTAFSACRHPPLPPTAFSACCHPPLPPTAFSACRHPPLLPLPKPKEELAELRYPPLAASISEQVAWAGRKMWDGRCGLEDVGGVVGVSGMGMSSISGFGLHCLAWSDPGLVLDPARLKNGFMCRRSFVWAVHCYLLLTTYHSLLTTHHSRLNTQYSMLTAHCSLLTAHHSPLTTHRSPLTTHRVRFIEGCVVRCLIDHIPRHGGASISSGLHTCHVVRCEARGF